MSPFGEPRALRVPRFFRSSPSASPSSLASFVSTVVRTLARTHARTHSLALVPPIVPPPPSALTDRSRVHRSPFRSPTDSPADRPSLGWAYDVRDFHSPLETFSRSGLPFVQSHGPSCASRIVAASVLPITLRWFSRSVTAVGSRCLASHRSKMCSVGLALVAK